MLAPEGNVRKDTGRQWRAHSGSDDLKEFKCCCCSTSRVQLFETPWAAACQASCPSPSPGVCSNLGALSQWCRPTVSKRYLQKQGQRVVEPRGWCSTCGQQHLGSLTPLGLRGKGWGWSSNLTGEGSWAEAVTFSEGAASTWELGKQVPRTSRPSVYFSAESLYWMTYQGAKSRSLIMVHKVSLSEDKAAQTKIKKTVFHFPVIFTLYSWAMRCLPVSPCLNSYTAALPAKQPQ